MLIFRVHIIGTYAAYVPSEYHEDLKVLEVYGWWVLEDTAMHSLPYLTK